MKHFLRWLCRWFPCEMEVVAFEPWRSTYLRKCWRCGKEVASPYPQVVP